MSVRAMFRSPQITSGCNPRWRSATNVSSAARNYILAGKSFPPFGTYTDATVTPATSSVTIRFS